jgi:hypothetical protein
VAFLGIEADGLNIEQLFRTRSVLAIVFVILSLHGDKSAAGEVAPEFPFLKFVQNDLWQKTKTRPCLAPNSRDNGRA